MNNPNSRRLKGDLLKDQWLWNYTWRGVKLDSLERMYGVPADEVLSIMRDIAHKYDPPDVEKLPKARCNSCGMRIIWGKQSGKAHPLDPRVLNIVTDTGELVRGRESHFVSCPNASKHRKNG